MTWRDASTRRAPTCIEQVGARSDASTCRVPTSELDFVVIMYALITCSFSEFLESICVPIGLRWDVETRLNSNDVFY